MVLRVGPAAEGEALNIYNYLCIAEVSCVRSLVAPEGAGGYIYIILVLGLAHLLFDSWGASLNLTATHNLNPILKPKPYSLKRKSTTLNLNLEG